jgi:predicted RNase H-like HicB family nuclease
MQADALTRQLPHSQCKPMHSIPGYISQGQTREESLENIKDAIAACLEVRAELGLPLTAAI